MVKLNAFTTIESLISAVLILTCLGIGTTVMLNVLASDQTGLRFMARSKLIELAAQSTEGSPDEVSYDQFTVQLTKTPFQYHYDLEAWTWTTFDEAGNEICTFHQLKKKPL